LPICRHVDQLGQLRDGQELVDADGLGLLGRPALTLRLRLHAARRLLATMTTLPAATLQLGHDAGDVLLHRRLVDATRLLLLLVLRLAPAIRREALGLDADLATRSRARRRGRRGRPLRRGRRTAQHVRGATQTRTLLGRRDARRALLGRLRLRPCHRLCRTLGLGRRRRLCLALLLDGLLRRRGSLCLDVRSGLGGYVLTPRLGGLRGLGRDRLGSVRCRRSTLRVDDDLLGLTILEERRLPRGRRCTLGRSCLHGRSLILGRARCLLLGARRLDIGLATTATTRRRRLLHHRLDHLFLVVACTTLALQARAQLGNGRVVDGGGLAPYRCAKAPQKLDQLLGLDLEFSCYFVDAHHHHLDDCCSNA